MEARTLDFVAKERMALLLSSGFPKSQLHPHQLENSSTPVSGDTRTTSGHISKKLNQQHLTLVRGIPYSQLHPHQFNLNQCQRIHKTARLDKVTVYRL
jgi:hypothetical protein